MAAVNEPRFSNHAGGAAGFESTPPVDFESAVSSGFELIKPRLKPGMSVAVGVGSRGISNLSEIVSLVIAELKNRYEALHHPRNG